MNHLLFYMTLSGSMALIVYYIINFATRKKMMVEYRYALLRISLLFYLLPVPLLANRIREDIRIITGDDMLFNQTMKQGEVYMVDLGRIFYYSQHGVVLPRYSKVFWIGVICWGIFCIGMIGWNMLHYLNIRKYMLHCTEKAENVQCVLDHNVQKISRRYKVVYRVTKEKKISFTCGLMPPVVVISDQMEKKELNYIVGHELAHIRQLDFLTRILSLSCRIVHFYNPLVYLLHWELMKASEECSDKKALKDATDTERKEYANLLLRYVSDEFEESQLVKFSQKKMIKERLKVIGDKRTGKGIVLVACVLMVFIGGTTPILAYTPVSFIEVNASLEDFEDSDFAEFQVENEYMPDDELAFQHTDCYYLSEDGNVINYEENDVDEYVACKHDYVEGTYKQHIKGKNGGCKVKTYSCKRCSKCGKNILGECIATTNYNKCPH